VSAAYVIEKGVPLPPGQRGRGLIGVIQKMDVNDSILVPDAKQSIVSASGRVVRQRTGAQFTTRVVEGGVRIWRVS